MPHASCGFELLGTLGSYDSHYSHSFTLVLAWLSRKNEIEPLVCLWGLQMNREHALRVEPRIFLINHTCLTSLLHAAAYRTPAL